MSAGRIVLLVCGFLIIIGAAILILSGGSLLYFHRTYVDSEGFITSDTVEVQADSYAIVGGPIETDIQDTDTLQRLNSENIGTIKIEGQNNDPSKGIFIGLVEKSDFQNYLGNVEYDEVTKIDKLFIERKYWEEEIEYDTHSGDSIPANPTTQTFWTASAYGTGTQTMVWELEEGTHNYWLVVMNEDGSASVDAGVKLAAKVSNVIRDIGLILLVAGIVVLIVGVLLVYLSLRGRKKKISGVPT